MPESDVSDVLRCEKCGSLEFVDVAFQQCLDAYAATPGAAMQYSTDPIHLLVCLCGNPIKAGWMNRPQPTPERRSLVQSVDAARRYRETQLPAKLGRFMEIYATKQQFEILAERVANLERFLTRSKKQRK